MPDVDIPDLDALLATDPFVKRSILSAEQLQALEASLGVTLPPDYRALALRYDLATLGSEGFRFAPDPPYLPHASGYVQALQAQLDGRNSPFMQLFNMRLVITVGSYEDECILALAVDTAITAAGVTTQPYGSLWLYDPMDPDPARRASAVFDFVSSSFTQAVHMMYYAKYVIAHAASEQPDELFAALQAIDPAIERHIFWRDWLSMLK